MFSWPRGMALIQDGDTQNLKFFLLGIMLSWKNMKQLR